MQDHIVQFIDMYEEPNNEAATLLVTELCPLGSLQTRIDLSSPRMAYEEILHATLQVARAIEYLHCRKLYHSDVKPRNILIRRVRPTDVVLADMADVKPMGRRDRLHGTPSYYSPEMVASGRYGGTGHDDMWALGITVLGMLGQWPQVRYTKNDLDKYPRKCLDHAQQLGILNPGERMVVGLLVKLLAEEQRRIGATECVEVMEELCEKDAGAELEIKAPDEFRPASFW
ncbi:hypothetical protein QQS21_011227 [Conoideocrella luteorostrata]|uniref:non-specific serine/threonine protein kinase n=1 Tax=Conoideocrella luteorostrata TaxID=1105319 RepID=A0AAJ0CFT9_9HYPO|nr:hypothetical protein QQS21_011227 [Conoideocrella luteorostrata]